MTDREAALLWLVAYFAALSAFIARIFYKLGVDTLDPPEDPAELRRWQRRRRWLVASEFAALPMFATLSVLLGDGTGKFVASVEYNAAYGPVSERAGDLNGDGKLDLAVLSEASAVVTVLLNRGDGTFFAGVNYPTGNNPKSVTIADIGSDGAPKRSSGRDVPRPSESLVPPSMTVPG